MALEDRMDSAAKARNEAAAEAVADQKRMKRKATREKVGGKLEGFAEVYQDTGGGVEIEGAQPLTGGGIADWRRDVFGDDYA